MSPNILTEMKSIEKYFILMTLNWGFYFNKPICLSTSIIPSIKSFFCQLFLKILNTINNKII